MGHPTFVAVEETHIPSLRYGMEMSKVAEEMMQPSILLLCLGCRGVDDGLDGRDDVGGEATLFGVLAY